MRKAAVTGGLFISSGAESDLTLNRTDCRYAFFGLWIGA
jgi:hypothetical protein